MGIPSISIIGMRMISRILLDMGGKGQAVRKEYLSYILMLDMKTEWAFSASFSRPPGHTVMDDGNAPKATKRQKVGVEVDESTATMYQFLGNTVTKIADAITSSTSASMPAAVAPSVRPAELSQRSRQVRNMEDMQKNLELMSSLEERQAKLESLPDDAPMKKMRLYVNEKAMVRVSRIMMDITKRDRSYSSVEENGESSDDMDDGEGSNVE